ncbi:hypothetical protein DL93DRAFT_2086924 [Clavulina sp. PMI_390]|nr:hypothetical protein DL93DRAFT_2086924 [Clavulina sp. PMI_390]
MDELGEEEFFMGSLSGLVALETLRVPARLLLSPSDGEGAPNGQDESGGTTVSRNPIDGRLPRTLITLQLGLDWVAFDSFCKRTGLPKSLHGTRQKLPSLINLTIGGRNRLEEPILQDIMRQIPALQPPINATFFGVRSVEV